MKNLFYIFEKEKQSVQSELEEKTKEKTKGKNVETQNQTSEEQNGGKAIEIEGEFLDGKKIDIENEKENCNEEKEEIDHSCLQCMEDYILTVFGLTFLIIIVFVLCFLINRIKTRNCFKVSQKSYVTCQIHSFHFVNCGIS
jgi:hypothetical protein